MQRIDADGAPPVEFWAYFDTIPAADFQGLDCSEGWVQCGYTATLRTGLVDSEDPDILWSSWWTWSAERSWGTTC